MTGRHYTEADFDRFRAVWADPNIPRSEVGAVLGLTECRVLYLARRLRVGHRPQHPQSRGYRDAHGLTTPRRRWSDDDIATFLALRADTTRSDSDIGEILGRSRQAVANMAHRMGLPERERFAGRGVVARRLLAQHAKRVVASQEAEAAKQERARRKATVHRLQQTPPAPPPPPLIPVDRARELLRRGIAPATVAMACRLSDAEVASLMSARARAA